MIYNNNPTIGKYAMKDEYSIDDLYVGNFKYVVQNSLFSPTEITNTKYIFEPIKVIGGQIKLREIFTGGIFSIGRDIRLNNPYVVNVVPLSDFVDDLGPTIKKESLLFVEDEINSKERLNKILKKNRRYKYV